MFPFLVVRDGVKEKKKGGKLAIIPEDKGEIARA